jgi:hypothetical protein
MTTLGTSPANPHRDELANRRAPRMYASVDMGKCEPPTITLDFCHWLHRDFDGLV